MRDLDDHRHRARGPEWIDGDIALPPTGIDVFHHLSPLNLRLRLQYLAGAEEESRRRFGRPLSNEDLLRVLGRYPGDLRANGRQR